MIQQKENDMRYFIYTACLVMLLGIGSLVSGQGFINNPIQGGTLSSGVHEFCSSDCILSPGTPNTNVTYTNTAQVTYRARKCIHLKDGFEARDFTGNGFFRAMIDQGDFGVALLEPTGTNGCVGKYDKMEIGIELSPSILDDIEAYLEANTSKRAWIDHRPGGQAPCPTCDPINPFDPEQINVEATFTAPGGARQVERYGFFYRKYDWENRRTPNLVGYPTNPTDIYNPSPGDDDYSGNACDCTPQAYDLTNPPNCNNAGASNCWRIYEKYGFGDYADTWVKADPQGEPEYNFRVRYAPDQVGIWQVSIKVTLNYDNQSPIVLTEDCIKFECTPATNPNNQNGYLEVADNNRYLKFGENDQFFFPVGHNMWAVDGSGLYTSFCPANEFGATLPSYHNSIRDIAAKGGNFTRIGMDGFDFNIEWENKGNYESRLGAAQEFDDIIDLLEEEDLYAIIVVNSHHDFQRSWVPNSLKFHDPMYGEVSCNDATGKVKTRRNGNAGSQFHWDCHPYRDNSIGIDYPMDVFMPHHPQVSGNNLNRFCSQPTDPVNPVWKYQKNKLRYVLARWGYSTHVAAWEVIDEINESLNNFYDENANPLTGGFLDDDGTLNGDHEECNQFNLYQWAGAMTDYVKNDLNSSQMVALSVAGHPVVPAFAVPSDNNSKGGNEKVHYYYYDLPSIDFAQIHDYGIREDQNFNLRFNQTRHFLDHPGGPDKPLIYGELGSRPDIIEGATDIVYHDNLWATSMMGCMGAGLGWSWTKFMPIDAHANLAAVSNFFGSENFVYDNWERMPVTFNTSLPVDNGQLAIYQLKKDNHDRLLWIRNRSYWVVNHAKTPALTHPDLVEVFDHEKPVSCNSLPTDPRIIYYKDCPDFANSGEQYTGNVGPFQSPFGHALNWDLATTVGYPFPSNIPDVDNPATPGLSSPEPYRCGDASTSTVPLYFPNDFDEVTPLPGKTLSLLGFSANSEYKVETFRTRGSSALPYMTQTICSNSNGKVTFITPPFDNADPDWAFKIKRNGSCPTPPSKWELVLPSTDRPKVFPNPNLGQFEVELPSDAEGRVTIDVVSLFGQRVESYVFSNQKVASLDLGHLAKGVYYLKISAGERSWTEKVVLK